MKAMARLSLRRVMAIGAAMGAVASVAVACVDLFHSTNFHTLCDSDPGNLKCQNASDASPPTLCLPTNEAKNEAARICAWFGACEGPAGESAFGNCMMHAQFALDCKANPHFRPAGNAATLWQCFRNAKACTDFNACTLECDADASAPYSGCTPDGKALAMCPGNQKRPSNVDVCLMANKTCLNDRAGCTGSLGVGCQVASSSCSGSWAQKCVKDDGGAPAIDQGVDCSGVGAGKCKDDENGYGAACVPIDGGTCTVGPSQPTCDHARTVSGCIDGQRYDIDCTVFGLTCSLGSANAAPSYDPFAACVAAGDAGAACADTDNDTCSADGDTLTSCSHGAFISVSCLSVGLGPCQLVTGGSKTYAACTVPSDSD